MTSGNIPGGSQRNIPLLGWPTLAVMTKMKQTETSGVCHPLTLAHQHTGSNGNGTHVLAIIKPSCLPFNYRPDLPNAVQQAPHSVNTIYTFSMPCVPKLANPAPKKIPTPPPQGGGVHASQKPLKKAFDPPTHPVTHPSNPLCDIPSGCCSFTGPWTVTRSSLRMLRRVAAFCRPLRPVLLLVSFPRSRSPVVGVLGLC